MLTTSVLLGLVIAVLRGGDLRRLATFPFRLWWVLVSAFLLKYLLAQSGSQALSWVSSIGGVLHVAIYGVVLGVLFLNWGLPWMRLAMVGVAANLIVVAANGGSMPVWEQSLVTLGKLATLERLRAGVDPLHTLATDTTWLRGLGDWIPVPGPVSTVMSPGDIFMLLGIILFVNTVTQPSYRPAESHAP